MSRLFFLFTLLALPLFALIQAAAAESVPLLRVLNTDPSEAKRLEALGLLETAGGISAQQVMRSICDVSPAVRAATVRAGTEMALGDAELEIRLIALANDHSPLVQAQLLKSLPQFPSARAAAAFQKLLATAISSKDPGLRALAESLKKQP